ncbi:AAA family ATPase [Candidatus Parcubacteria bacterium]|nr:AAA family ATPase [Candidatus Parcubacteria bacterium]
MYLKSIELSGFKSFAKKSVLEFTSTISAIVGPNGSGKSNVAEAFRFVLGEQSMKSLRGKKGEDLIFNGAGSEARANRAAVKVVFDNSKRVFGIDFPEVSMERVVHRDGVNEYLINGSTVRLKDVVELLARAHIGASGHHIISQGEADRILNTSEKERKGMIEDALGLKIYQYKRLESERKLTKTFENIAQVEGLRKEIAPHLKFLRKQAEKIEKSESLRDELLSLAREYFKREEMYITHEKAALASERGPIEATLEKLHKELADAKRVLETSAKGGDKNFKVLDLESEIAHVRAHKDGLVRELGKVEGLLNAEERIIRKERELATSEERKMIRLKDVEALYEEVSLLESIQSVISRLKDFIKSQKHSADSSVILEAEKSIQKLVKDKEKAEKDIKLAEDKEQKLRNEYESLKREIEEDKDSSRDAEKAVFRVMSEENELLGRKNVLKAREDKMKAEEEEWKRGLAEVGALAGEGVLGYRSYQAGELEADRKMQEERKRTLERLKIRLEEAGISGAGDVLKEFKDVTERDEFLARELLDLDKSAESLKALIKDLETRLAVEFSQGLTKINAEFGKLFSTMFGGGEAKLTLTKQKKKVSSDMSLGDEELDLEPDAEEAMEEGLEVSVSLPRKKIRGLMMLSGGERALTSIALLFAVSAVNPPPFIILDETDAALDEANSKRYGDMVVELAKHSQLILITHNRETMGRAGIIYGVTMGSTGVSKLLSIAFDEAVQVAK